MAEYPSVTLFGPRQCGKTTLAKSMFPDYSYANLEDFNTRTLAKSDPDEFFNRFPSPIIIDEIQKVPELLSSIQFRIDREKKKGQYLLTGSNQIEIKGSISQSLAGRTAIIDMLPLSIQELQEAKINLDREAHILAGGMPFLFAESGHSPFEYFRNYVNTYVEKDIAGQNVRDLSKFVIFLKLLAGRTGQLANNSAIAAEVGVATNTIASWVSMLEASHIIYVLRPWFSSRTSQVVKTPKIYFCDTGLAAYLLGIETPAQLQRDPLLGNLFENLVVLEALKTRLLYPSESNLFFYRNSKGLEVDLLFLKEGKLHLFEMKSGKALNEDYSKSMLSFAKHSEGYVADDLPTVVYSGDDAENFKGTRYRNFKNIHDLFESKTEKFVLNF